MTAELSGYRLERRLQGLAESDVFSCWSSFGTSPQSPDGCRPGHVRWVFGVATMWQSGSFTWDRKGLVRSKTKILFLQSVVNRSSQFDSPYQLRPLVGAI
jgi:hypothetical protein